MAHHIGVTTDTIAGRTGLTVAEIGAAVEELAGDDIIELAEAELDWADCRGGTIRLR